MKILVTGANGQLGMSLRRLLSEAVFTDVEELDITDAAAIKAMVAEIMPLFRLLKLKDGR